MKTLEERVDELVTANQALMARVEELECGSSDVDEGARIETERNATGIQKLKDFNHRLYDFLYEGNDINDTDEETLNDLFNI